MENSLWIILHLSCFWTLYNGLTKMNHVKWDIRHQLSNFCWLGRKLFGGRFIRFMSGPKNESNILTGSSTPNRFVFVSLAVIQSIYKHCISKCFLQRVNVSPPFLFPLNPGISWKWTEYLSVLCLKVSIDQFCRKQFTKLANLLMHSQCALSEPISSSRKMRKLTVCRFI